MKDIFSKRGGAPPTLTRKVDSRNSLPAVGRYARNFSKKGGTRPPSPREVNSRGSSPAVGRFVPSGLPSLFPRLIEMIPMRSLIHLHVSLELTSRYYE